MGKPSTVQLEALAFIETHPSGFTCTEFSNHLGFRPLLTGAALKYRVAAAQVLEELLYQLVLAEDA